MQTTENSSTDSTESKIEIKIDNEKKVNSLRME